MKPTFIEARDLSEAFFLCCREVLASGYEYVIDKGSFEGQRRKEFDFITLQVKQPSTRPLAPDVPLGVPSPTNDAAIETYMSYLITPEKQKNELYTYGEDLAPQIPVVIERYRKDGPECNQLTMSVGSRDSMFLEHSQCLRVVDTRIRYGALHFMVYFRSWDLWAGFPVNLGGLQLLKEHIAKEIGVEDGELWALSKGLHLYEHCWEIARITTGL